MEGGGVSKQHPGPGDSQPALGAGVMGTVAFPELVLKQLTPSRFRCYIGACCPEQIYFPTGLIIVINQGHSSSWFPRPWSASANHRLSAPHIRDAPA